MSAPLLEVKDLGVRFVTPDGTTTGLDGVSLEVGRGEILGVVGETGCGKTLTGLSILGLLPATAKVSSGSIRLDGEELLGLPERSLRQVRGAGVGMVFQNPASAFNPVFSIGWQMRATLAAHESLSKEDATTRIRETLAEVGLPEADRVLRSYPHQLSGGMLQRAMIASALLCRPRLLIADEPTTALDVTIEAQILRLIRSLQASRGFSVLFITHDLGVIRRVSDRVAVLYAGRVVETAPTTALFERPEHPYTRGLMGAVPDPTATGRRSLVAIPGSVPADPGLIVGCAFADRCPLVFDRCREERPAPRAAASGHDVACHLVEPGATS